MRTKRQIVTVVKDRRFHPADPGGAPITYADRRKRPRLVVVEERRVNYKLAEEITNNG